MTEFILRVEPEPKIQDEQREERTRALRDELLDAHGIEAIDVLRDKDAPVGSKGDPVLIGALLVKLASSGGLTIVINTIKAWLLRQESQSVSLEIGGDKLTITGISTTQQQQLIDSWISRHTRP